MTSQWCTLELCSALHCKKDFTVEWLRVKTRCSKFSFSSLVFIFYSFRYIIYFFPQVLKTIAARWRSLYLWEVTRAYALAGFKPLLYWITWIKLLNIPAIEDFKTRISEEVNAIPLKNCRKLAAILLRSYSKLEETLCGVNLMKKKSVVI